MGASYSEEGDNVKIQNCPALKNTFPSQGPRESVDTPTTGYCRSIFHTSFWNGICVPFLEKVRTK